MWAIGGYFLVYSLLFLCVPLQRFPEAQFILVPDAGHSAREDGIIEHLLDATDRYKSL